MSKVEQTREADVTSASPLTRLAGAVGWLGGVMSTLLIVAVLALVTYAVVQRYMVGRPLPWADELSGYILVAIVMFGCAEAYRRGDHIAIDLLADRAGPRLRRLLEAWSALAVLVLSLVLLWSAWGQIKFAYDFGSFSPGEIEIASWIPQVPMLFGWLAMALVALARLLDVIASSVVPSERAR